jgi:hypothetical protein
MAPIPQKNSRAQARDVIVAAISGSDTAAAEGVTVTSASPILNLCRQLVDAGFDLARPLLCYRGQTLALSVRTIGEGNELEVNSAGTGFVRRRGLRSGPPVRVSRAGHTGHHPGQRGAQ